MSVAEPMHIEPQQPEPSKRRGSIGPIAEDQLALKRVTSKRIEAPKQAGSKQCRTKQSRTKQSGSKQTGSKRVTAPKQKAALNPMANPDMGNPPRRLEPAQLILDLSFLASKGSIDPLTRAYGITEKWHVSSQNADQCQQSEISPAPGLHLRDQSSDHSREKDTSTRKRRKSPMLLDIEPLSPAEMILDLSFLASKGSTLPLANTFDITGGWHCATGDAFPANNDSELLPGVHIPTRPSKKRRKNETAAHDLPPSVVHSISNMLNRDLFTTGLPIFVPSQSSVFRTIGELWYESLNHVTDLPARKIDHTPFEESISLSTVEHDNTQLQWGRKSRNHPDVCLPVCQFGEEGDCDALRLEFNQGPLHPFMSIAEEQEFQEHGKTKQGPCLMCWRAMAHSMQIANRNRVFRCDKEDALKCALPARVLVDKPGGYHRSAVVTPLDAPICAPFVKSTGTLKVKHDNSHGLNFSGWYIDQGGIVFGGFASPLN